MTGVKPSLLAFALALTPAAALAAGEFGSEAESRAITDRMVEIINSQGVDAGIAAMHDGGEPFVGAQMGVHVFESGIIVADNREPELIATSYEEVADLTEEPMWPRIVAAADAEGEAQLKWYHYDTEAVYDYQCFSKWTDQPEILVMTCR